MSRDEIRVYELRQWIERIARAFPEARVLTQPALASDEKIVQQSQPSIPDAGHPVQDGNSSNRKTEER
jgi:hypothetical protein